MGKVIFITGGVQSGKARWAVNYFGSLDDVMYMCAYPQLEKDIADRIEFNCKKQEINWNIQIDAENLDDLVRGHKFAVLDNLAQYTNKIIRRTIGEDGDLGSITPEQRKEVEKQVIDDVVELIWEVKEIGGTLLLLSLELGLCPIPSDPAQKVYRKMMGTINQRIAAQATEMYLLVSGVPCKIK
jgi:adenosylcobinamide kinase/adenosylcobinamide-phosphate guanylyltransferase